MTQTREYELMEQASEAIGRIRHESSRQIEVVKRLRTQVVKSMPESNKFLNGLTANLNSTYASAKMIEDRLGEWLAEHFVQPNKDTNL